MRESVNMYSSGISTLFYEYVRKENIFLLLPI